MCDSKKVPIIIPEGMSWPTNEPIPEIEVVEATIRKTKVDNNGITLESTKTVYIPLIPNKD